MNRKSKKAEPAPMTAKTCRECHEDYEPGKCDDGFCSDTCENQYNREIEGVETEPDDD